MKLKITIAVILSAIALVVAWNARNAVKVITPAGSVTIASEYQATSTWPSAFPIAICRSCSDDNHNI